MAKVKRHQVVVRKPLNLTTVLVRPTLLNLGIRRPPAPPTICTGTSTQASDLYASDLYVSDLCLYPDRVWARTVWGCIYQFVSVSGQGLGPDSVRLYTSVCLCMWTGSGPGQCGAIYISLSLYPDRVWVRTVCGCIYLFVSVSGQGLGPDSVRLYPLLTPVIRLSTDLSGDAHVYLMEDGLALWQAAVENAPQMHPDFMEVSRHARARSLNRLECRPARRTAMERQSWFVSVSATDRALSMCFKAVNLSSPSSVDYPTLSAQTVDVGTWSIC